MSSLWRAVKNFVGASTARADPPSDADDESSETTQELPTHKPLNIGFMGIKGGSEVHRFLYENWGNCERFRRRETVRLVDSIEGIECQWLEAECTQYADVWNMLDVHVGKNLDTWREPAESLSCQNILSIHSIPGQDPARAVYYYVWKMIKQMEGSSQRYNRATVVELDAVDYHNTAKVISRWGREDVVTSSQSDQLSVDEIPYRKLALHPYFCPPQLARHFDRIEMEDTDTDLSVIYVIRNAHVLGGELSPVLSLFSSKEYLVRQKTRLYMHMEHAPAWVIMCYESDSAFSTKTGGHDAYNVKKVSKILPPRHEELWRALSDQMNFHSEQEDLLLPYPGELIVDSTKFHDVLTRAMARVITISEVVEWIIEVVQIYEGKKEADKDGAKIPMTLKAWVDTFMYQIVKSGDLEDTEVSFSPKNYAELIPNYWDNVVAEIHPTVKKSRTTLKDASTTTTRVKQASKQVYVEGHGPPQYSIPSAASRIQRKKQQDTEAEAKEEEALDTAASSIADLLSSTKAVVNADVPSDVIMKNPFSEPHVPATKTLEQLLADDRAAPSSSSTSSPRPPRKEKSPSKKRVQRPGKSGEGSGEGDDEISSEVVGPSTKAPASPTPKKSLPKKRVFRPPTKKPATDVSDPKK